MKITLDSLAFGYNGNLLFSDISAELSPGKLHTLAGPNGCGQSTLLKLMCSYLEPVSGRVLLDDKPIGKYSFAERSRRLGVVWQSVDPGLDFSVETMVEILASARFPRLGKLSAENKKLIHENLERFGLLDRSRQLFSTLSGGEKQLLLLAAAATLEPDVLLLDEPTSALDPAKSHLAIDFLNGYAREHTVLAITHDMTLPCEAGGQLWLLDKSGNFSSGNTGEMLTSEHLSRIYETPVSVESDSKGRKRVFF